MAWLTANWFWVLIGIAFITMHLFGHGGHGGHGRHGGGHRQRIDDRKDDDRNDTDSQGRVVSTSSGGHQHRHG
jgi:hypothetical protein